MAREGTQKNGIERDECQSGLLPSIWHAGPLCCSVHTFVKHDESFPG